MDYCITVVLYSKPYSHR